VGFSGYRGFNNTPYGMSQTISSGSGMNVTLSALSATNWSYTNDGFKLNGLTTAAKILTPTADASAPATL
jgi:hypothetical protein